MNEQNMDRWQNLMALSAPSYAGDFSPPYGFVTRTLAEIRAEAGQRDLVERIGLRALFASLGILLVTAALTFGVNYLDRSDLEPGLRNIVQVENVQLS